MGDFAVRTEGLSKRYRIGHQREAYGRLTESLSRALRSPLRTLRGRGASDFIWALKDVSLEVPEGEVVGLIGRNGAGKTTLLKILSRITEPTEGYAELNGRVGSLLEVGTGFHPELTGRENIFLNGAVLGMRRREIQQKFDEIVSFAEIEKFLETPVKHYSSGMYVRLAFSVAAHLEPDILLVDEVLAVGDAAFQRKSVGKMSEVAQRGRTVLFVSHNLAAIRRLCTRCVLLEGGTASKAGPTGKVLGAYLRTLDLEVARPRIPPEAGPDMQILRAVLLQNDRPTFTFATSESITLAIDYVVRRPVEAARIGVWFMTPDGYVVMSAFDTDSYPGLAKIRRPGRYQANMRVEPGFLNSGEYLIRVLAYVSWGTVYDERTDLVLEVADSEGDSATSGFGYRVGAVVPRFKWTITSAAEE